MNSLIFLGIIPGTNIQISFYGWLIILAIVLISVLVFRHRKDIVIKTVRHKKIIRGLYASELHFRPSFFN